MVVLIKWRYYWEHVGLLVGSLNLRSVVPAITRLSHGTTRIIRPSGLGAHIPNEVLAALLSKVMWLPPKMQILFFTFGLSFNRILSDQVPVQFTTYLAFILYYFLLSESRISTPMILPLSSLTKSRNYALFRTLDGTNDSGILMPLPRVAVNKAESKSLESLKDPSS